MSIRLKRYEPRDDAQYETATLVNPVFYTFLVLNELETAIVARSAPQTQLTWSPPDLLCAETYRWRVLAEDSASPRHVYESETRELTTGTLPVVTLVEPTDGATDQPLDVALVADRADEPVLIHPIFYTFVVRSGTTGEVVEASKPLEYTVWYPPNLRHSTIYTWSVMAKDSSSPPRFCESAERAFTTRTLEELYVTHNGSATSNCTPLNPCNLDRANVRTDDATLDNKGIVVFLKQGTYSGTKISPTRVPAGEIERVRYQGDPTNTAPAIIEIGTTFAGMELEGRSFVTIDGTLGGAWSDANRPRRMKFQGVGGIGGDDSTRNWGSFRGLACVVRNCEMAPYAAKENGRGLRIMSQDGDETHDMLILDNIFDMGFDCKREWTTWSQQNPVAGHVPSADAIFIAWYNGTTPGPTDRQSTRNIVAGNRFERVPHSSIKMGHNRGPYAEDCIIRDNEFLHVHEASHVLGARNVYEYNVAWESGCGGDSGSCYFKVEGKHNIFRFNRLVDDDRLEGEPAGKERTFEEELIEMGLVPSNFNKLYHNVLYGGNAGPGINFSPACDYVDCGDDETSSENNFVYNNVIAASCECVNCGGYQLKCKKPTDGSLDDDRIQLFSDIPNELNIEIPDPLFPNDPNKKIVIGPDYYHELRGNIISGREVNRNTFWCQTCLVGGNTEGITLDVAKQRSLSGGLPDSDRFHCDVANSVDATNLELTPSALFKVPGSEGTALSDRDFRLKGTATQAINAAVALTETVEATLPAGQIAVKLRTGSFFTGDRSSGLVRARGDEILVRHPNGQEERTRVTLVCLAEENNDASCGALATFDKLFVSPAINPPAGSKVFLALRF